MRIPAHYIYARSGTLHGNINPNAIYMDRTTGRGFLVDWEYRTHVVAPGGYIPLRSSTVSYVATSSNAVHTPSGRLAWTHGVNQRQYKKFWTRSRKRKRMRCKAGQMRNLRKSPMTKKWKTQSKLHPPPLRMSIPATYSRLLTVLLQTVPRL